jgi:hypothetical protein
MDVLALLEKSCGVSVGSAATVSMFSRGQYVRWRKYRAPSEPFEIQGTKIAHSVFYEPQYQSNF